MRISHCDISFLECEKNSVRAWSVCQKKQGFGSNMILLEQFQRGAACANLVVIWTFFFPKWNLEHRPFRMVISMEFLIHPHPLRDGFPGISAAKASQHKTRLAWKQRFFMYSSHVTLWSSSSFVLQKPRNEQWREMDEMDFGNVLSNYEALSPDCHWPPEHLLRFKSNHLSPQVVL